MSEASDTRAARVELAFFGTVTASLSHELKNVLAIIGELNGLLYDLGRMANPSRPMDPERVKAICEKLSDQVKRGEQLIRLVNRFSHSADETADVVNLADLVKDTVELSRRFAYLKRVTLEVDVSDEAVVVSRDPFACMYTIFLGIQLALSVASEQRKVSVSMAVGESGPEVRVESADPFDRVCSPRSELRLLESAIAEVDGRLVFRHEMGKDQLCLRIS